MQNEITTPVRRDNRKPAVWYIVGLGLVALLIKALLSGDGSGW